MALEPHPHPARDADGIVDAEVLEAEEAGRVRRARAWMARQRAEVQVALAEQRVRVAQRLAIWFAAGDVTDEQLAQEVEYRRRRAQHSKEAEVRGRIKALQAELRAAAPEEAAGLGVQLSGVEAQLALIAGDADADRMKVDGRALSRARWSKKAGRVAGAIGGGALYLNGVAAEPGLALAALVAAPFGWWYLQRPLVDGEAEAKEGRPPVDLTKADAPVPGPRAGESGVRSGEAEGPAYAAGAPAEPVFDAPLPPALDDSVLAEALRRSGVIKPDATITVLSAPPWGENGTSTTVFDLPSGVTVTMLKKKIAAFAGALGREVSMLDINKAGAEGRVSLWMTDTDPFADPRPSPLMTHSGGIDVWKDGVPVAWAKRGNSVCLPVKNSSFVIAGMTRSGKGVGAANLAVGAALDVRVNLRIVAGKVNGEWDPYAKQGVAATYFKPDAHRLLALLGALKADMDRRNRVLGELSKSKVTPETINRVGGLELLVIDELATFTRTGKPLREEILGALTDLSAVAAGAGILLGLITQYPEVDVIPQALAMNCGTRWAMRVDNATQSNAILGGGASGSGRDASKFDPPLPGLGWLVNPFAGVTDLARSYDLDEDERGEVTALTCRAAELRDAAGRLTGQWADPIEAHLLKATGLSSAAGGPERNGVPGRPAAAVTPEEKQAREALVDVVDVMDNLGRDAQLEEMAAAIGDGMTAERLGELLRRAGAGPTVKVSIDGRRVNGYRHADLRALLDRIDGV